MPSEALEALAKALEEMAASIRAGQGTPAPTPVPVPQPWFIPTTAPYPYFWGPWWGVIPPGPFRTYEVTCGT